MPVGSALAVLAALVVLATVGGLVWRARNGRVIAASGRVAPRDLDVASVFGSRATLVQFSTEFCAQCPATRRLLGRAASDLDGVEHVEVDLTHRADLAGRFNVRATPTVLLLDGTGRVRGRIVGAPRPLELQQRLTAILEGLPA